MKRQTRADLTMAAAILLLGASLVFSGFSLLRLHWGSGGADGPFGLAELLAVGCAGAGAALLCWWLLALACAFLAATGQALGATKLAAFSEQVSPAFMRRLVAAVLGLNLLAAPLAQAAGDPAIDPRWQAETVATQPATASPTPTSGLADSKGEAPGRGEILPPTPVEAVAPQWVPGNGETDPGPLVRPALRPGPDVGDGSQDGTIQGDPSPADSAAGTDVVVKRGDSLWSIVAVALGPYSTDVDVAMAWPAWYLANRETIGADPNLILPGQVFHAP